MDKTKIKICGLTTKDDVLIMNENKVDYVGFVLFYSKSKRNLELEKAIELISLLDKRIKTVAVTVNPTIEQAKTIEAAGFDLLQVHGLLSDEIVEHTSIEILHAFQIDNNIGLEKYKKNSKIVGYVFDGKVPGSGEVFDWSLIRDFNPEEKILMLAGGLHSGNVIAGINAVHPSIVDVSSGVEKTTGIGKDAHKVREFVNVVRGTKV